MFYYSGIQGAVDTDAGFDHYMEIDLSGFDLCVTKKILNRAYVRAGFEQVRCE